MSDKARFLVPEPPSDDARVERLFVNREDELGFATEQVAAVRAGGLGRPMAVVGQARVGKSHLLRRIEMLTRNDFDAAVRIEVSTGLSDSRAVLRAALAQVYAALRNAALTRGLGEAEGPGVLVPIERILADFSEAVAGSAAEVELSRVVEATELIKRSAGLSAKLGGLITRLGGLEIGAEASAERGTSRRRTGTRRVKVNQFEEATLTELIVMAHVLVREHEPRWTTLFVLDDFDLLKRDESGKFDPGVLLQALCNVARVDGLHVLTTVREDTYWRHDKSFHRIAYVGPFEREGPLREVFRRHVETYHDGNDPFAGGFVDEAIRRSEGRVGIFLRHLRDAYELAGPRLSRLDLKTWVAEQWDAFARRDRRRAEAIVRAVEHEGGQIRAEDLPDLRGSALMRWILEDYTSESAARVEPVLLSYLRERSG